MLLIGRHVNNLELAVGHTLLEEVVTHVNVLGVGRGRGVVSQMKCAFIILLYRSAPNVNIRKNKSPTLPQENRLLEPLGHCNVLRLRRGKRNALLRSGK